MRIIFIYFLALISLNSCEKKCNLKPIPKNVFDLEKIKEETVNLKSGNNIDILIFNDKYDSYTEKSFNGPMNKVDCGHSKSYIYKFRNETIQISLDKNDEGILELDLTGWFNKTFDSRIINENELLANKEYFFEREADCDSTKSQIQRIILKGYLIKSITTTDNKVWTPI